MAIILAVLCFVKPFEKTFFFLLQSVQYFPRNYLQADNVSSSALKMTLKGTFGNENSAMVQKMLIFLSSAVLHGICQFQISRAGLN